MQQVSPNAGSRSPGPARRLLGNSGWDRHTGRMQPNQGTVVGDLRVLLLHENTGRQHWYWWLIALATELMAGDAERYRHIVRLQGATSGEVLAERSFDKRSAARKARESVLDLLRSTNSQAADPEEIQSLLDSFR